MTPAQRLTTAADTIERTAQAAGDAVGPDPWQVAFSGVGAGYGVDNGTANVGDDMTEETAGHVALWDPPTAQLAATLLRTLAGYVTEAERLGLTVDHGPLTTAALNLADHINTQATT